MLKLGHLAIFKNVSQLSFRFWFENNFRHWSCVVRPVVCRKFGTKPSIKRIEWGKNKLHRKIILKEFGEMLKPEQEEIIAPLRAAVKEQGDLVRHLKSQCVPQIEIQIAISELKARKKVLEDKELEFAAKVNTFDRSKMEDLLKRRFFYDQSFGIYGGVTGQFDFGPMGCAIKSNILALWRSFFILEEQMLEVDCAILTPEPVLKTSGHVDRFADVMVKDLKTGECFRLDHLIKASLEKLISDKNTPQDVKAECEDILIKLDGLSKDEMGQLIKKFDIKSPISGAELSEPMDFCLMFETHIGPTGLVKGYLRPETAQGIFVNFKRLLLFNNGKLPFAAAQIGQAFRNEISPRSGLIRVREFTLAEIEHFCDPQKKNHPKFANVADTSMVLYSACNQMDGKSAVKMSIGEAVEKGLVANETLGYFMAKIQKFLLKIGLNPNRLRFRQHMSNEMAHYATDCWDAECLTSYGWIECVGCADRSAFDLTQHTKSTGTKLVAERRLPEPKTITVTKVTPMAAVLGKTFKNQASKISSTLAAFSDEEALEAKKALEEKGSYELKVESDVFTLTNQMLKIELVQKTVHVEEFTPNVIEPSFGIGRIMYALFEQSFRVRDNDEQRRYFALPPIVAPIKCSLLPLGTNPEFYPLIKQLSEELTKLDVTHKVDDSSGSIGRRYARTDEIAIPFGITIDFDSFQSPPTATLRERDTTSQIRVPIDVLPTLISDLARSKITWTEVAAKYPKFEHQESTAKS